MLWRLTLKGLQCSPQLSIFLDHSIEWVSRSYHDRRSQSILWVYANSLHLYYFFSLRLLVPLVWVVWRLWQSGESLYGDLASERENSGSLSFIFWQGPESSSGLQGILVPFPSSYGSQLLTKVALYVGAELLSWHTTLSLSVLMSSSDGYICFRGMVALFWRMRWMSGYFENQVYYSVIVINRSLGSCQLVFGMRVG